MPSEITFGKLPTRDSCIRLMQVSFASPQKNLAVYRFCNKVFPLLDFMSEERSKIVKKYGDYTGEGCAYNIPKDRIPDYDAELRVLFDTEVGEELVLGLTEEDFETCHYPTYEKLWLSAGEMQVFFGFKEENNGRTQTQSNSTES